MALALTPLSNRAVQWLSLPLQVGLYIGLFVASQQLLIAFAPGWLGTPLHAGTNVTRGIPIGVGLIVMSFVLTGVYVWRANGEFDRLTKAILREVKS